MPDVRSTRQAPPGAPAESVLEAVLERVTYVNEETARRLREPSGHDRIEASRVRLAARQSLPGAGCRRGGWPATRAGGGISATDPRRRGRRAQRRRARDHKRAERTTPPSVRPGWAVVQSAAVRRRRMPRAVLAAGGAGLLVPVEALMRSKNPCSTQPSRLWMCRSLQNLAASRRSRSSSSHPRDGTWGCPGMSGIPPVLPTAIAPACGP
jgi:hypothetical protein